MNAGQRFQQELTTGRITLPVSIILCLFLWLVDLNSFDKFGSMILFASIGYLLIEMNTAFSLIRTRTTSHVCLYWLMVSISMFLHPFDPLYAVAFLFTVALFQLFGCYEREDCISNAFNVFLCLSAGSLLFPQLLFFCIPFYIGMAMFRSLTFRTFLSGFFGILLPYWFLFVYAVWTEQLDLFLQPLKSLVTFPLTDYSHITISQWIAFAIVTSLSLISSISYLYVSYQDKTRTRMFLSFLIFLEVLFYLFFILQPQHFIPIIPIQIFICSIMTSHLFVLEKTRFSFVVLIVTLVVLALWALYNLFVIGIG